LGSLYESCRRREAELLTKSIVPILRRELLLDQQVDSVPLLPISDGRAQPLPDSAIQQPFNTCPILGYLSDNAAQPFVGVKAVIILHFLRDLLAFMESLRRMGMSPDAVHVLYKEYPYPQRDAIAVALRELGFNVEPLAKLGEVLASIERHLSNTDRFLLIEDGGYALPEVLAHHAALSRALVGSVEQTRRGVWNMQEYLKRAGTTLAVPVVSVAQSTIKNEIEPRHVAEAVVANIGHCLPDIALAGLPAAVLGFGSVGQRVAECLKSRGALVRVYDARMERGVVAANEGFETSRTSREAVAAARLIVGASGQGALQREDVVCLPHSAYLVSASSDRREFPISEIARLAKDRSVLTSTAGNDVIGTTYVLRKQSRQVHLIADGYPINFWWADSMPNQVSDVILSLILLGACSLVDGAHLRPGIDEHGINALAEEKGLAALYRDHHTT
jgi:S-adenosylhomocysteine hydrolase